MGVQRAGGRRFPGQLARRRAKRGQAVGAEPVQWTTRQMPRARGIAAQTQELRLGREMERHLAGLHVADLRHLFRSPRRSEHVGLVQVVVEMGVIQDRRSVLFGQRAEPVGDEVQHVAVVGHALAESLGPQLQHRPEQRVQTRVEHGRGRVLRGDGHERIAHRGDQADVVQPSMQARCDGGCRPWSAPRQATCRRPADGPPRGGGTLRAACAAGRLPPISSGWQPSRECVPCEPNRGSFRTAANPPRPPDLPPPRSGLLAPQTIPRPNPEPRSAPRGSTTATWTKDSRESLGPARRESTGSSAAADRRACGRCDSSPPPDAVAAGGVRARRHISASTAFWSKAVPGLAGFTSAA